MRSQNGDLTEWLQRTFWFSGSSETWKIGQQSCVRKIDPLKSIKGSTGSQRIVLHRLDTCVCLSIVLR